MTAGRRTSQPVVPAQFGVPIESALARRERLANSYDYDFGQERVFSELVDALLARAYVTRRSAITPRE